MSKKRKNLIDIEIDKLVDSRRPKRTYIDIEIDKLTNSIENTITGEVFNTLIVSLTTANIKELKKKDWVFDWTKELKHPERLVYRLSIVSNPDIVQGLISIEDKQDHFFMHLIESANFNKGKHKMYYGVPGNLVAFACKMSFEKGYYGYLVFDAKTSLIKHYEHSLGAIHYKGLRMFIEKNAATRLVFQYFKS